jgi:hypothetical protein
MTVGELSSLFGRDLQCAQITAVMQEWVKLDRTNIMFDAIIIKHIRNCRMIGFPRRIS